MQLQNLARTVMAILVVCATAIASADIQLDRCDGRLQLGSSDAVWLQRGFARVEATDGSAFQTDDARYEVSRNDLNEKPSVFSFRDRQDICPRQRWRRDNLILSRTG